MKSAFPKWLRKADPTLAAEETNPLYEAFRRRRLNRRRSVGRFMDHAFGLSIDHFWYNFILLAIGVPFLIYDLLLLLLFLVAVMSITVLAAFKGLPPGYVWMLWSIPLCLLLGWGRWKIGFFQKRFDFVKGIHTTVLPHYLLDIISSETHNKSALEDLWLVNVSGDTIAEAIYLEWRERSIRASRAAAITFAIAAVCSYAYVCDVTVVGALIVSPAIVIFAAVMFAFHTICLTQDSTAASNGDILIAESNAVTRAIRSGTSMVRTLFSYALLAGGFNGIISLFLHKPNRWIFPEYRKEVSIAEALLTVASFLFLITWIRRTHKNEIAERVQKQITRSGRKIEEYIRRSLSID